MIIVTSNDVPGYRISYTFGECFGLTVRSRNIGSNIGAGFEANGRWRAQKHRPVAA